MKNKEKYDLRKLDVTVRSSVDRCGHKIEPKHITVMYGDSIVHYVESPISLLDILFDWLESEEDDRE